MFAASEPSEHGYQTYHTRPAVQPLALENISKGNINWLATADQF